MYTSHYGPRQGIYQPIESFKTSNWRVHYLVLSHLYGQKSKDRIKMPPNSFPARSLVKHFNSMSLSPCSSSEAAPFSPISMRSSLPSSSSQISRDPSSTDCYQPPFNESQPSSVQYSPKTQDLPKTSPIQNPSHQPRYSQPALTTVPARMHQRKTRPTVASLKIFSYPDPFKLKEERFTKRLVELARLECDTMKQEMLGRLNCQVPPTTSASSLHSVLTSYTNSTAHSTNTTTRGGRTMVKRFDRPKSAKTKAELEQSSGCKHHRRLKKRRPCHSTQSMFDLPVAASSPSEKPCSDVQTLRMEASKSLASGGRRECSQLKTLSSCNLNTKKTAQSGRNVHTKRSKIAKKKS